jgi:DNA-binding MarR family transcriptional regulator
MPANPRPAESGLPPWPTTICVGTAIRRADRALGRIYEEALRPTGLAPTQYSLLSIIARAPAPLTIHDLAGAQVMDRTTLTRVLAPLVRDGLIQLAPGEDRRTRIVTLTPEGESTLANARPYWREAQDRIIDLTGQDRIDALLAELAEVVSRVR